jgi:hypothetical protein
MSVIFTALIRLRGINPYVLVGRAQARSIRSRGRGPLPVLLRLNEMSKPTWRVNMMPSGDGRFYLYLHGGMRRSTQTKVGDRIRIELELDSRYHGGPQQPLPPWFASGLESEPRAYVGWRALPPSRKKEIVRYLARLKSPEARARNLARVLRVLAGGHARFMGREWKDGS